MRLKITLPLREPLPGRARLQPCRESPLFFCHSEQSRIVRLANGSAKSRNLLFAVLDLNVRIFQSTADSSAPKCDSRRESHSFARNDIIWKLVVGTTKVVPLPTARVPSA